MKVFLIQLLSITFVLLIIGSIQSVTADHLEPGQGIFKNEREIEFVLTNDSNYQIYLQTVLRNGDGQMISVAEGMHGFVIPHKLTDHVFDTLMGKKEIVTIDNIKYEKAQLFFNGWIGFYSPPNFNGFGSSARSSGSDYRRPCLSDSARYWLPCWFSWSDGRS